MASTTGLGVSMMTLVSIGWIARRYGVVRYRNLSQFVHRRKPCRIGDSLEDIETPCLVVDLDRVRLFDFDKIPSAFNDNTAIDGK